MRLKSTFIASALSTLACSGTGQSDIEYQAYASPVAATEVLVGDWTVTVERATVAFGPVYFCAAASGSATLCETAVGELATISRFDGLDPTPQPLGLVRGFEGGIRSASYDYGIHWFITEPSPVADPSSIDGHSVRLEGRARRAAEQLEFSADVDLTPQFQGQRAISTAPAVASVTAGTTRLEVRFDVAAWVTGIDFDALSSVAGPHAILPGDRDHTAIVIAITSGYPPDFVWTP